MNPHWYLGVLLWWETVWKIDWWEINSKKIIGSLRGYIVISMVFVSFNNITRSNCSSKLKRNTEVSILDPIAVRSKYVQPSIVFSKESFKICNKTYRLHSNAIIEFLFPSWAKFHTNQAKTHILSSKKNYGKTRSRSEQIKSKNDYNLIGY